MSAVERLVLRLQAVSGVDWSASGRGRLYEEQKGNFTAILSDPAVIAELFAETLCPYECSVICADIRREDEVLTCHDAKHDPVPQLRRLLTQEGGGQAPCFGDGQDNCSMTDEDAVSGQPEAVTTAHEEGRDLDPVRKAQPATPDLLPKEESDG